MALLRTYKIISYILLPFAAFLGMSVLFMIMVALGNPHILFSLFVSASTVIYIFTSFSFIQNGIVRQLTFRSRFKDWIRVNGLVALIFAGYRLFESISLIVHPELLTPIFEFYSDKMPPGQQFSLASFQKIAMGFNYFFMSIIFLLIVHVVLSFLFIKKYAAVFNDNAE